MTKTFKAVGVLFLIVVGLVVHSNLEKTVQQPQPVAVRQARPNINNNHLGQPMAAAAEPKTKANAYKVGGSLKLSVK